MRIYTQSFRKRGPKAPAKTPALVLVTDNWNDFGHRTLFNAFYFSKADSDAIELGLVKILQRGKISTTVKDGVAKLPENYCSMGQSAEYYSHIQELPVKQRTTILTALRDI